MGDTNRRKILIKKTWIILVAWTLILSVLLVRDLNTQNDAVNNLALREATAHFQKDEAFRFWSAIHGGFYVPVSERTPPNPHLAHVFERDIETKSGIRLTLMNLAYALRQMNEDFTKSYGVAGHITSLLPLRPENKPDNWERMALESFEKGDTLVLDYTKINNKPFLRLMKPLITKQGCLKCHAHQGYKVGDVRGGVSVSVPLNDYYVEKKQTVQIHLMSFLIIWILGIGLIVLASWYSKKNMLKRDVALKLLKESYNILEIKVGERTAELSKINSRLNKEIAEHLSSKDKLVESEIKYRTMFKKAPLSFQSLDKDGYVIDVNPMWIETLGYSREEVIGKWFGDFLRSDYVEHFRENFPEFKKAGSISDVQFYMKKKNGGHIYTSFEGRIGYTTEGIFKQTYCVFKDITKENEIGIELKKNKEYLEEIVEERTSELEQKNRNLQEQYKELERYNKLMVGREYRIKELRDEIEKLKSNE